MAILNCGEWQKKLIDALNIVKTRGQVLGERHQTEVVNGFTMDINNLKEFSPELVLDTGHLSHVIENARCLLEATQRVKNKDLESVAGELINAYNEKLCHD